MKKSLLAATCLLLLSAMPADAFHGHWPILRHHAYRGPLVTSAAQILGVAGTPQALASPQAGTPQAASPQANPQAIYVDSSVKRNIDATRQNLSGAGTILQELLDRNKLRPASPPAGGTGEGTIDNPKV